ncbi:pentapeptide repeat-containing protein [Streptomyces sp. NPDC057253]|uniref:pentapeptide repeat-containing protein n=1 Tax=Streptomyces sp. NPDC057253 TaxID=3346069 RepID=UPI00362D5E62
MAGKSIDRLRRTARRRAGRRQQHGGSKTRRSKGPDRIQWITLIAASLPGIAALGALLFTWMQVGQASKELQIAEQGHITGRFNAAIGNLGSESLDIRLGGIYALQRIMQDSDRDQPAVVSVLAAFAQRHAGSSTKSLKEPLDEVPDAHKPSADVTAAIATLARRRPDRDRGAVINLSRTDLRGLRLPGEAPIELPGADLDAADLRHADLSGVFDLRARRTVDLHKASLAYANLGSAFLAGANLSGAQLWAARLTQAELTDANLRGADMTCGRFPLDPADEEGFSDCVDLTFAYLEGADLRNTKLSHANLSDALLNGADLRGADLAYANLTNADFRGAKLTGAKLKGTKRTGARGLPPER